MRQPHCIVHDMVLLKLKFINQKMSIEGMGSFGLQGGGPLGGFKLQRRARDGEKFSENVMVKCLKNK